MPRSAPPQVESWLGGPSQLSLVLNIEASRRDALVREMVARCPRKASYGERFQKFYDVVEDIGAWGRVSDGAWSGILVVHGRKVNEASLRELCGDELKLGAKKQLSPGVVGFDLGGQLWGSALFLGEGGAMLAFGPAVQRAESELRSGSRLPSAAIQSEEVAAFYMGREPMAALAQFIARIFDKPVEHPELIEHFDHLDASITRQLTATVTIRYDDTRIGQEAATRMAEDARKSLAKESGTYLRSTVDVNGGTLLLRAEMIRERMDDYMAKGCPSK